MWPHAIHNRVPVRIIHASDLSNSSITLTTIGHTRLFARFRLASNKVRSASVAPHAIELEQKNGTDYRLPGTDVPTKKMKHVFQWKSKVTNITYTHILWYHVSTSTLDQHEPQYLKQQETTTHPCSIQDRSIPRSLKIWGSIKSWITWLTFSVL